MGTVAIFGAGVMGETLLSGLVRAGRRVDELVVTERRAERAARARASGTACAVVANAEAAARPTPSCWWSSRRTWATLLDEIAPDVRPGQLVV